MDLDSQCTHFSSHLPSTYYVSNTTTSLCSHRVRSVCYEVQMFVGILVLISCVTLDRLLSVTGLPFLCLENRTTSH